MSYPMYVHIQLWLQQNTRYFSLFHPHPRIFQSASFSLSFSKGATGETETSFYGTKPFQPGNSICNLTAQINM